MTVNTMLNVSEDATDTKSPAKRDGAIVTLFDRLKVPKDVKFNRPPKASPYHTKRAENARRHAENALPVELDKARAHLIASGIKRASVEIPDVADHNVMSLTYALQYAACGLHVLDSHSIDPVTGLGTGPSGSGKLPRGSGWPKRASNDATEILSFWAGDGSYPASKDGKVHSYARVTAPRNVSIVLPVGCATFVLDIDGDDGKYALAELVAEHGELPKTPKSITGSGGWHFLFRTSRAIRNTASEIATGIDIRGENGQIIAPPSVHHSGNFYHWAEGCAPWECDIAQAPEWLEEAAFSASKKNTVAMTVARTEARRASGSPSGAERAAGFDAACARIGDGLGGFDGAINSAACSWWGANKDGDADQLVELLRAVILAAPCKNNRAETRYATDGYLADRVENARIFVLENDEEDDEKAAPNTTPATATFSYDISDSLGDTLDDAVVTLGRRFAYVNNGGKPVFMRRPDPNRAEPSKVLETFTLPALKEWHSDRMYFEKGTDGKAKAVNPVDRFVQQARRHSDVTFAPEPLPCDKSTYNLWAGFAVERHPGEASCAPIIEFLKNVICDGRANVYAWLELWLAHLVQRPGEKPGTALVLQGGGGCGKSTFGEMIHRMCAPHSVYASSAEHVTGNFNSHLATAIMLVSDEAFFGGDPKLSGVIKGLVTEKTTRIEPKGIDSFEVPSCLRSLFIGNPKRIVPIETNGSDRRYLCVEVPNTRKGDTAYFEALTDAVANGGLADFIRYLRTYDPVAQGLTWSAVREAPVTRERLKMRYHSLRAAQRAVATMVQDGTLDIRTDDGRHIQYRLNEDGNTLIERQHMQSAIGKAGDRRDSRDDAKEVLTELFGDLVATVKRKVVFWVLVDGEPRDTPDHKERAHCFELPPLPVLRAALSEMFGTDDPAEMPLKEVA